MTITTRSGKGSELTWNELDTNFTDLRDGVAMQVPKEANTGIKIDSLGTPDWGWHDLQALPIFDPSDPNGAIMASYRGTIKQIQFQEGNQIYVNFHIPHDYVVGSNLFLHVHWSQTSATATGGSVTWAFETTYAKGHQQAEFHAPVTASIVGALSATTPYHHYVTEAALSVNGGSANQLDTSIIEVDGVIFCRFYLDSNDLTDSVSQPDPFVHFVDLHYQSTNVATKNKAPNFYGA